MVESPLAHRELAYHHRRTLPVTVVHDLHQVVSLGLAKLLKTPVVYYQKPRFPKLTQKLSVTSVGLGLREGKKQPRDPVITNPYAPETRVVSKGARNPLSASRARFCWPPRKRR